MGEKLETVRTYALAGYGLLRGLVELVAYEAGIKQFPQGEVGANITILEAPEPPDDRLAA